MKKELIKPWQTTTSALDIAQYLLSLDPQREYFTLQDGNMRMNCLLHIMQILHYAKYSKMLFYEDMLAMSPNFWKDKAEQQQFLKSHAN